uniref:HPt domain-containing protein n=1 Tax=uncultured bacterium contig00059 TaxID=1181542 RepID=A0A0A6ZH27_9BACT|nr:hypothetical protein [uncultured bacterium contig00059]
MTANDEFIKVSVQDAQKAIAALEKIYPQLENSNDTDADVRSYVIAVHGMKNVLANIGETELSHAALKLEQAGRNKDIAIMLNETPAFITALQAMVSKFKLKENTGDSAVPDGIQGEDTKYLCDKLSAIKEFCDVFNINAARNTLIELNQKTWPLEIKNGLDVIGGHLLHSAMKKAASAAEDIIANVKNSGSVAP